MTAARRTADPVATELQRRLEQVISKARRALDLPEEDTFGGNSEAVATLISSVESRLATLGADSEMRASAEAHAGQLERLYQRYEARFTALASVRDAIARLRTVTSPSTILSRAPEELCTSSQLERAVLSVVRDGSILAQAAYFRGDPVGADRALEALAADPPRLEHPLIEAELLRRRRASTVTDAQQHPRVHRPTAQTMGWQTYLAAPLVVRGEVIGVIHADAGSAGRALEILDGDVLWTFATGLAQIYETTYLRRALRRQRTEMRTFVEWLSARSSELSDASMEFVSEEEEAPEPPGQLPSTLPASHVDDRVVFEDVLTRRELDVLRLLARGETNGGIAAQLVISQATVKFHVVNILRKLHVSNRAEAVSRYHRLVQSRPKETDSPRQ
jgi:DNA-binding CsgD family transcriptional regulator